MKIKYTDLLQIDKLNSYLYFEELNELFLKNKDDTFFDYIENGIKNYSNDKIIVTIDENSLNMLYFKVFYDVICPVVFKILDRHLFFNYWYRNFVKPNVKVVSEHKIEGNIINHINLEALVTPFSTGLINFINSDLFKLNLRPIIVEQLFKKDFIHKKIEFIKKNNNNSNINYSKINSECSIFDFFNSLEYGYNTLIDNGVINTSIIIDFDINEDNRKEIINNLNDFLQKCILYAVIHYFQCKTLKILNSFSLSIELKQITRDVEMFYTRNVGRVSKIIEYLDIEINKLNNHKELNFTICNDLKLKIQNVISHPNNLVILTHISDIETKIQKNEDYSENKIKLINSLNEINEKNKDILVNIFNFNCSNELKKRFNKYLFPEFNPHLIDSIYKVLK